MPFESLSEKLQGALRKITGRGRLSEQDVKDALREVRLALLEADVNFKVARDFITRVQARAVGAEVAESLTPAQQIIKIVSEELTQLMGGANARLTWSSAPPTVYMLCGLQGAGKTTFAAKLAGMLKKQGEKPLLVAGDVYRPAAIKQLQVVAQSVGVPVFEKGTQAPEVTAAQAVEHAKHFQMDPVIIDTAGRLHIDDALMQELERVKQAVRPQEILLTVDAMIGQESVNVAQTFNERLGIDGVILTKLDGDARGGAALSVKAITGKPIKFCGTGEKLDQIEPFYPDRMASRILGMGDVLTLIEKAQENIDEKKALEMAERLKQNKFTLSDYYEQLIQIKSMGNIQDIAGMIPGIDGKALSGASIDEKAMLRTEAIIQSMTPYERDNPNVLNGSRKRRIAAGSGTDVTDVNRLLKQFDMMKQMAKQFAPGKRRTRFGKKGLFGF